MDAFVVGRVGYIRRGFFAMLVVTGLFPFSLLADTVPIVGSWIPVYTYSVIIGIGGGSPACNGHVDTGEFPTREEALAALLAIRVDIAGCGGWTTNYYYFKADPNPDQYQYWQYSSYGNLTYDYLIAVWPIGRNFQSWTYKKQCPTPTTRPEVPYTPNPDGQTCSRPDACLIPPLKPLDPSVQPYEDGLIDMDNETQATSGGAACIVKEARARHLSPRIISGYRPPTYQTHIREVYDKWQLLENNYDAACADTKFQVQVEFVLYPCLHSPCRFIHKPPPSLCK
jgi:hypothetical protein